MIGYMVGTVFIMEEPFMTKAIKTFGSIELDIKSLAHFQS
jgi:hypothetical protein